MEDSDIEYDSNGYEVRSEDSDSQGSMADFIVNDDEDDLQQSNIINSKRIIKPVLRYSDIVYDDDEEEDDDDDSEF